MAKTDKETQQQQMSRVEKIEKQIEDLKAKKAEALKKENAKKAQQERKKNVQKRKLEAHLKIVIGGYIIATKNTGVLNEMLEGNLREQDKKALNELLDLLSK